jgi:hypothetical protein
MMGGGVLEPPPQPAKPNSSINANSELEEIVRDINAPKKRDTR